MSAEAHLTAEQLLDLVEGRISATDRSAAAVHLSACVGCHRRVTAYGRLIDLMRTDESLDAPEHVLNRAFRLLRTHRLAASVPPGPRRFTALLRRDSLQSGFAVGVRGTSTPTRQLLFDIGDDNELELRIEAAEGGWRVAGQILGTCSAGHVLLEGVAGELTTELNAQCEFSLPPHPGPIYRLVLLFEEVEIEVPILELRG